MISASPFLPTQSNGTDIVDSGSNNSILDVISAWQAAVLTGYCGQRSCMRCQGTKFKRHELRRRQLRVIVEDVVQVMRIVIARWRCQGCRYVFTDYPDFRTPLPALRQLEPLATGPQGSRQRSRFL